jgi:ribonucrease Y
MDFIKKLLSSLGGNASKDTSHVDAAKLEAEKLLQEAKSEAQRVKHEARMDKEQRMFEAAEEQKKVARDKQSLADQKKNIDKDLQQLESEKNQIEQGKKDIEVKKDELAQRFEKLAGMSGAEAKELLLKNWEDKLKKDVALRIKDAENEIKEKVDIKAKELLLDSMRFGTTDYVSEFTVSSVPIQDDMKGRIIGKDGRNIRAFELATGVDVDLEAEGEIKLSSFDAMRREVARQSLERLLKDGRIQPQRIEEVVNKTRQEIDKATFKAGEELAHKVGVYNLPVEVIQLLGKFKYRFSFGQNLVLHTIEETQIGVNLAQELGANVNVVRLGCLLHDIGKVINDKEGSHVELGVELLKRYKFPQHVQDVIASHHEDIPLGSMEAIIVYIADAVSGGRPGARHEDFENYLKRITTIEEAAKTKKGVKEAYALQAGRELRVIVRPTEVNDEDIVIMAQNIKDDLEAKFDVFPGQIKVTIIRETRAEVSTRI